MLQRYNSKPFKDHSTQLHNYLYLLGTTIALFIILFILFYPPMPGVADQGDFQRVMTASGLSAVDTKLFNSYDSHWFKYVMTEYKILPVDWGKLIGTIPSTSIVYPITAVRLFCNLFKTEYFSTKYLSFIYALVYILAFYVSVRHIKFKRMSTNIFFITAALFILVDGDYIIWFNSLYGEPMMIVGLLLLISFVLYSSEHIEDRSLKGLLLTFFAAFLFLGAKIQCFVILPFIIFLIIRMVFLKSKSLNFLNVFIINILIFTLIFYVKGIYIQVNTTCGVDTKYNSVFYGILKNSLNPKKDLAVLGLPSDMSIDAGKHAYLPQNNYVKYAPGSDLIKNEFNTKINNLKLFEFYLFNPKKLLVGMEYTASKSFDTSSSLGKYEKSDVREYTSTFNRFNLWSNFRNSKLPKNLFFLIPFYFITILVSIIEHIRMRSDKEICLHIELFWLIIIISLLQFPMPYIGNGEADTAKQLFLFNYCFDIIFLVAVTWIYNKLSGLAHLCVCTIKS